MGVGRGGEREGHTKVEREREAKYQHAVHARREGGIFLSPAEPCAKIYF